MAPLYGADQLYYFYQNTDKKSAGYGGPEFPIPEYQIEGEGIVKTNSFAAYFNGNLHLLKYVELTAGLRYTYEYKTVKFNLKNNPSTNLYIDVDNYTDTYSESVISPKIGLNFSFSPSVFLYGYVAQGFTSGGWNVYFINTLERIKFLPEYATNFEVGLKSTWFNNRVTANLSTFLTKIRDYQIEQYFLTEESTLVQNITNAGKVTTKGFELEASMLMLKNLKVSGGWGFADATFDEFKNGGGEGVHYDGNRLPWSPRNKYNISFEYQHNISNLGNIVLFGEFVHQGDFFCWASNDIDLTYVDSHELLNARISFHFTNNLLGISIWGNNLLDDLYILYNMPALFNTPAVWYGPPRTFGVEIYYNFLR